MKKQLIFLSLFVTFFWGCSDDSLETKQVNTISATIDSVKWKADEVFTQKERGENGPLIIVGEGEDYTLELVLSGIETTGSYPLGASRSARITLGNTTYSTMDVSNAGSIEITRFANNQVEGTFTFDAQWLSAGNRLEVREGSFKVFYY